MQTPKIKSQYLFKGLNKITIILRDVNGIRNIPSASIRLLLLVLRMVLEFPAIISTFFLTKTYELPLTLLELDEWIDCNRRLQLIPNVTAFS
jgi:hypothetical protein